MRAAAYLKWSRASAKSIADLLTLVEQNEGGHHTDTPFARYILLCFGINFDKCNRAVLWHPGQPLKDGRDDLIPKGQYDAIERRDEV